MLHARKDYDGIQPWPQQREHIHTNIPDDEPVFLIRGQDVLGPEVVEFWAAIAKERGVEEDLVHAVFAWADKMREWQREHGAKIPDTPAHELRK